MGESGCCVRTFERVTDGQLCVCTKRGARPRTEPLAQLQPGSGEEREEPPVRQGERGPAR